MNLLATAASIIGAALVGRPLSSDAFKLGVGAAKSSTVDSYLRLERLLTLVSVLTTVGLTLVADTQFHAFGVQAPHSYTAYSSIYIPKATRTTRLAATPTSKIAFADSTHVGLWIAGIVLAIVGGSGIALIRCGGQTGQNRSSSRPSGSSRQEGDDPGGRRQQYRGGPQPWPTPPPADPSGRSNGSRSRKPINVSHKTKSREDPPPPPPPPTTTACGDDDKPEVEQLLLGFIVGLCLSVLAKVINKFLRNSGKKRKAPKRDRKQPARINASKTAARALAICVLPVVPLTLLAACAWNQGPPHSPGKLGPIKVGVVVSAATLATFMLYILFVAARTVLGRLHRFYSKMTEDYDDFDEDVGDQTWTGDDSGDDDNDNDDDDGNDENDDDNLGSNFVSQQYTIEDVDHIDDVDLGSDFFGEQYDIEDLESDPNCSQEGSEASSGISGGELDPIYLPSESESGDQGDEDDVDGSTDLLPLESIPEETSVTQPSDIPVTPPPRPVPRGEPDWTPTDDRRSFAQLRHRAIMAGDSPVPGGLLNSPPSPAGISLLRLPLPDLGDDSDESVEVPEKHVRFHNRVRVRLFSPDNSAADESPASV